MSFEWLDEYEGIEGGVQLQWELMQPFNLYDMVRDPSTETVVKGMYMPAIGYTAYRLTTLAVGEAMPSFWVRAASRFHDHKTLAQVGVRSVPTVALVSAPVISSVGGAVIYEKTVNRAVREAHGGWDIDWFGPFASGWGTVV